MAEESQGNGAYQMITPPNLLKAKVGGSDGVGGIDPDAIEQASSVIENLADDFEERVALEIALLLKLSHDLDNEPERAAKIGSRVARIGHELAGQGATFGFDLITEIGTSMTRYIERLKRPDDLNGEVLRAHADAMRAVVKNKVKGDGGAIGTDLVTSLEQLVERMTA